MNRARIASHIMYRPTNLLLKRWLMALMFLLSLASADFTSVSLTGRLEGSTLEYQVNPKDPTAYGLDTITIRYTVPRSSWVAVGVSPDGSMINSEVVIAKPVERTIRKHRLTGRSTSSILEMPIRSFLINATFAQSGGITTLTYTKYLVEDGEIPINPNGANNFVAAFGRNNTFGFHQGYGSVIVNLSEDTIDNSPPAAPTTAPVNDGFRQVTLGGILATTSFQYRLNRNDANINGADTVSIRFTCPGNVWVGVGVARDFGKMVPAKAVIGFPTDGSEPPQQYYLQARDLEDVTPLPDDEQVLNEPQIVFANDETTLSYTIPVFSPGMNATDEALEIRADGLPTNFNIACGMIASPSFHRLIGSFSVIVQDSGPLPNPIPVPSPTDVPVPAPTSPPVLSSTDPPDITPTNVPVSTPTAVPINDFRQVPLGGVLAEDPFEYRLNRNDTNADGADTISIRFTCPGYVWVGVGVSRDYGVMVPSRSVIGFPGSEIAPLRYSMQARNDTAVNPLPDDEQVLIDPRIAFANDKTTLSYTLPVYTTDMNTTDEDLEVHADGTLQTFIIACGSTASSSFHRITGSVSTSIEEGGRPIPLTPAPSTKMPASPIVLPTSSPISVPTGSPIGTPTDTPVLAPTDAPVALPINAPAGLAPTNSPSGVPTVPPTLVPSDSPIEPTTSPSIAVPTEPTVSTPTESPVVAPTDIPIAAQTDAPFGASSHTADGIGRVSISGIVSLIMMGVAFQDTIG